MKIVILNTVPYGSTGRIAQNIAKEARLQGHDVYFICGWTKHRKLNVKMAMTKEYVATNFSSKLFHLIGAKLTGFDGCFSRIHTYILVNRIRKINPDIIHLHIMHDYFLCLPVFFKYIKNSGIQVVWTFHDCWAFTGGCAYFSISGCREWMSGCTKCENIKSCIPLLNATSKMWKMKLRFKDEISNLIITTPSDWLAEVVRSSFYKDCDIRVIRNGIDLLQFTPVESQFKEKYNCINKYIVLGVAFDWGKRKGLDVFNDLAKLLPDQYQIVLVGTNRYIDKIIDDKIISIHKTSSQKELVEIYSAADVFVNPTREEVFGMVNIEALACGTPVVTFATDGAPEGIDENCGIVVEVKSAHALISQIQRVCEQHLFSKEACVRRAALFDEKVCYQDYISLYQNLVIKRKERKQL